ncbi:hypothetical protein O1611_g4232 [Lasiodiplodia mahajangana]|uniref:Uncharacterized protein n=1 Tax=Lasiodiplodia mahajangana TaxID=1108764 RepID=A0ACC2JPX3_9PEZI|nr:hypothetical protein O1611_g4232 [Lasiodiplodia mahajangana]
MGPASGKRRVYMEFGGWQEDDQIYVGENGQFDLHGSVVEYALPPEFPVGLATAVGSAQRNYFVGDGYAALDSQLINGTSFDTPVLLRSGFPIPNHAGFIGDYGVGYTYNTTTPVTNTSQTVAYWPPQQAVPTTTAANLLRRPYSCSACFVSFRYSKDLARHAATVHATENEPAYCCRCGKDGRRKDNYLRHLHTCNKEPRDPDYICICRCREINKEEHIHHVNNCRFRPVRPNDPGAR